MSATGRAPRGFVYAATGDVYTTLARRSARRLKAIHPTIPVDLFTDAPLDDPVFDRVHRLSKSTRRPKMEALGRSRFDATILLDADTIAVTRIAELFHMTRRYPLSASFATGRPNHLHGWQRDIPLWFPVFNAGVLVARRGHTVRRLARQWDAMMQAEGLAHDQPALRRLCWDLRVDVGMIPVEYNVIHRRMLDIWAPDMGAPRLLHLRALHDKPPGDPFQPLDYHDELPAPICRRIDRALRREARVRREAEPMTWTRTSRLGRVVRVLGQRSGLLAPRLQS